MNLDLNADRVSGLGDTEKEQLRALLKIFDAYKSKNSEKAKYYAGDVTLADVNLGIALPDGIGKLEIGCAWGAKCVDVLAGRSMFDGFVGQDGQDVPELAQLVQDNNLVSEYKKHCRDELTFGCTFATLSKDDTIGCRIRFHTPQTAAAHWNGEKSRIDCGFAVIALEDTGNADESKAKIVNLYNDTHIWVIQRENNVWKATGYPHNMGRPPMEPMIWDATSDKPLGQSRISQPVRRLIDGYVRTMANASIALEFSTAPQKYILGVTDEQYDKLINNKFRQYIGSMLAATTNPDTGENPTFGQLPQGNIQPHVEQLRMLSTQFSAATGLSVADTGVVNDANPTSSDALQAQTSTLIGLAEDLNTANGNALLTIALMALAVKKGVKPEDLSEDERNVAPHFRSPARPNLAASADAATKIAGVRQSFAQTDEFLSMMGFEQADIRRIKAQERRARGLSLLADLTEE